ncbi:AlbA family DNA-binding domain-containing protein [Aureimonas sp. AU40]|uniref:AlbA family DNA-binding domain-containing protein n=1 Tax=Aureimonas sp. AU40 TaxID=1637747 RepID=UPI000B1FC155|nr:ATP-binding protein [Aureimonas sp. AU40]
MSKRNITDEEIGLIKAMLKRGMRNDAAHFHFNRQDRLISPGRIAQIKSGKYGGAIASADDVALDRFLTEFWQRSGASPKAPMSSEQSLIELFENDGANGWRLKGGETDRVECKRSFRIAPEQRFAEVVKAIAGMANNKGGIILFGVVDRTLAVEGLTDDEFEKIDPAMINRILAGALDPIPHVTKSSVMVGGKAVGILTVEPHASAPVIALKMMGQDVKEGCVYFRYVGETRTIKPGELRQIIAMREQRAVADFSRRMVGVATGTQATLDLESGQVQGNTGAFVIDQTLLPQLQFIREGDFSEVRGAPALRLVGDVQPIDKEAREKARIIRDSVTPDSVIRNFLSGEKVADALQYIYAQAHCQRGWLPLWYYVKGAGLATDALVEDLRSLVATHPSSRDNVVHRLRNIQAAYKVHPGRPSVILKRLVAGEVMAAGSSTENMALSKAIMGLPDGFQAAVSMKSVVLEMLDKTSAGSAVRSAIYRAACRLDEILYR